MPQTPQAVEPGKCTCTSTSGLWINHIKSRRSTLLPTYYWKDSPHGDTGPTQTEENRGENGNFCSRADRIQEPLFSLFYYIFVQHCSALIQKTTTKSLELQSHICLYCKTAISSWTRRIYKQFTGLLHNHLHHLWTSLQLEIMWTGLPPDQHHFLHLGSKVSLLLWILISIFKCYRSVYLGQ